MEFGMRYWAATAFAISLASGALTQDSIDMDGLPSVFPERP
ncbi:MAG: hypothetical protein ABJI96_22000 [Paracoccaceae bacterium]